MTKPWCQIFELHPYHLPVASPPVLQREAGEQRSITSVAAAPQIQTAAALLTPVQKTATPDSF